MSHMSPRLEATLVTLMVETRDWNPKACKDAVQALTARAPGMRPTSFARIVANYVAAENEQGGAYFTSPKLLPEPGPHWDKTEYATRTVQPRCPDHRVEYPCHDCDTREVTRDRERLKAIRQREWEATQAEREATRQALHGQDPT